MGDLVPLLLAYKYWILMPIVVVEGPITTLAAGFLVTLGVFNPFWVYIITVIGDLIGDSLLYVIGRYGSDVLINRFGKFFRITPEKLNSAEVYFENHHLKAIVFSKLLQGIGFAGLLAAGSLKTPYGRYFKIAFVVSIIQVFVFLMAGILFGEAYKQLSQYLDYFAAGTITVGLLVIAFLLMRKYKIKPKP